MVEQYRAGYWAITHFNLFIADIPLTGHMHTPEKHEPWQKQGHHVTLDLIWCGEAGTEAKRAQYTSTLKKKKCTNRQNTSKSENTWAALQKHAAHTGNDKSVSRGHWLRHSCFYELWLIRWLVYFIKVSSYCLTFIHSCLCLTSSVDIQYK